MNALQNLHGQASFGVFGLAFVYAFLPVFLILWHLSPVRLRPWILSAGSMSFYLLACPEGFPLTFYSILLDFAAVKGLCLFRRGLWRNACFWTCTAKNLALIAYFGTPGRTEAPLGLLVYCVLGISAALEARGAHGEASRNIAYFASYMLFFPRLYAGPLSGYEDFASNIDTAKFETLGVSRGFGLFAAGLLKYSLLGKELLRICSAFAAVPKGQESVLSAWMLILSFALSLYFTLSGLAGIASGISLMMGIRLPQNFYYPYQSRGVSDFFGRFNMTFGSLLTRTLQPKSTGSIADCVSLLLTGALWGAWFGVRQNYILWGMFIGAVMILEKYAYPGAIGSMPTLFLRGYTFFAVMISFSLLALDSPGRSLGHIGVMLGFLRSDIALANDRALYVLTSNMALLLISLFLSSNVMSLLTDFLRKAAPRLSAWALGTIDFAMLTAFTAFALRGGSL